MFFKIFGAALTVPAGINLGIHFINRALTEVVIPWQEVKLLKKRRAAQAASGVPESKREVFHYMPLGQLQDVEVTDEEFRVLQASGALDILVRGANRRPLIRQIRDLVDG